MSTINITYYHKPVDILPEFMVRRLGEVAVDVVAGIDDDTMVTDDEQLALVVDLLCEQFVERIDYPSMNGLNNFTVRAITQQLDAYFVENVPDDISRESAITILRDKAEEFIQRRIESRVYFNRMLDLNGVMRDERLRMVGLNPVKEE